MSNTNAATAKRSSKKRKFALIELAHWERPMANYLCSENKIADARKQETKAQTGHPFSERHNKYHRSRFVANGDFFSKELRFHFPALPKEDAYKKQRVAQQSVARYAALAASKLVTGGYFQDNGRAVNEKM